MASNDETLRKKPKGLLDPNGSKPGQKKWPGKPRRVDQGPIAIERTKALQHLANRRLTAYKRVQRALKTFSALASEPSLLRYERAITELSQQELMRRLQENPEELPPTVLNRLKDSGVNHIARVEQWDKPKGHDPKDALSAIAHRMSQIKGKLKIEVTMGEDPPDPDPIDITPLSSRIEAGTTDRS